mgnify:FL=1
MQSHKQSQRPERLSAEMRSPTRLAYALLLLLSAATLGGCAHSLPSLSVEPAAPLKIPLPPVTQRPPPSGTYWQKHCEFRQKLQERLNVTLERSEHCSTPGQATDAPLPQVAPGQSTAEAKDKG